MYECQYPACGTVLEFPPQLPLGETERKVIIISYNCMPINFSEKNPAKPSVLAISGFILEHQVSLQQCALQEDVLR